MKILSVCVPTYKREGELLRLAKPFLESLNEKVELCVSSNCPSLHLKSMLSEKPNVFYREEKLNQGINKNTLECLRMARGRFSLLISDEDELVKDKISDLCSFLTTLPQEIQVVAPLLWSPEGQVLCGACHRNVTATSHRNGCLDGPLPGYWAIGVLPAVYGYISGWIYRTDTAGLNVFPEFPSAFEGNPYAYDVYRIHRLNQGAACQARMSFPAVKLNRNSSFQSQLSEDVYGVRGRTLQYIYNKKLFKALDSLPISLKVSAQLRAFLVCCKQLFAGGNLHESVPGVRTNRETCETTLSESQIECEISRIECWILVNICSGKYRESIEKLIGFGEKVLALLTVYHLIHYRKLLNRHNRS
jgi:glycosyltransferase involved in cell wall biosynthesis